VSADLCHNSRCEVLVLHRLVLFLPAYEGVPGNASTSSQRFNGKVSGMALYNLGDLLTSAISRLLH
jgi:hypothetical protein